MNLPKYPIEANNDRQFYEFVSEGPMGKIKKVVLYENIGNNYYNLGFGDWNEELQRTDDSSRTNNGDRDKVLATVAFTALDFTSKFPEATLFVEGSSPARTRLYQMGIAYNLLEITKDFEVQGIIGENWESFQRGRNYHAFLIHRK